MACSTDVAAVRQVESGAVQEKEDNAGKAMDVEPAVGSASTPQAQVDAPAATSAEVQPATTIDDAVVAPSTIVDAMVEQPVAGTADGTTTLALRAARMLLPATRVSSLGKKSGSSGHSAEQPSCSSPEQPLKKLKREDDDCASNVLVSLGKKPPDWQEVADQVGLEVTDHASQLAGLGLGPHLPPKQWRKAGRPTEPNSRRVLAAKRKVAFQALTPHVKSIAAKRKAELDGSPPRKCKGVQSLAGQSSTKQLPPRLYEPSPPTACRLEVLRPTAPMLPDAPSPAGPTIEKVLASQRTTLEKKTLPENELPSKVEIKAMERVALAKAKSAVAPNRAVAVQTLTPHVKSIAAKRKAELDVSPPMACRLKVLGPTAPMLPDAPSLAGPTIETVLASQRPTLEKKMLPENELPSKVEIKATERVAPTKAKSAVAPNRAKAKPAVSPKARARMALLQEDARASKKEPMPPDAPSPAGPTIEKVLASQRPTLEKKTLPENELPSKVEIKAMERVALAKAKSAVAPNRVKAKSALAPKARAGMDLLQEDARASKKEASSLPSHKDANADLQTMKLSQLKQLARRAGVAVEKVDGCDDADDPKAAAIALVMDAQASSESRSVGSKPLLKVNAHVMINGIESKPKLNGQLGRVVLYEGGPAKRYQVRVTSDGAQMGVVVSVREGKLKNITSKQDYKEGLWSAQPRPAKADLNSPQAKRQRNGSEQKEMATRQRNGREIAASGRHQSVKASGSAKRGAVASDAVNFDKLPLGPLSAKGTLIPSYSWVKVPDMGSVPTGLELHMPFNGTRCARIPSTWTLKVYADGHCKPLRCDVGRNTPVADLVQNAALEFQWELRSTLLQVDGVPLCPKGSTVGSAALFGREVTAHIRVQ